MLSSLFILKSDSEMLFLILPTPYLNVLWLNIFFLKRPNIFEVYLVWGLWWSFKFMCFLGDKNSINDYVFWRFLN